MAANTATSIPALPLRTQVTGADGLITRPWLLALQGFTKSSASSGSGGSTSGGSGSSSGSATVGSLEVALAAPTTAISSGVASPVDGQCLAISVVQDSTGGRTITWDVSFAADTPTDISPKGGSVTRFFFVYYGGVWRCHAFQVGASASGGSSSPGTGSGSLVTTLQQTISVTSTGISSGVSSPSDGQCLAVGVTQDGTGGRAITWDSDFATDTPTDISPRAGAVTRFWFVFYGGLWKCHGFFAQP